MIDKVASKKLLSYSKYNSDKKITGKVVWNGT